MLWLNNGHTSVSMDIHDIENYNIKNIENYNM